MVTRFIRSVIFMDVFYIYDRPNESSCPYYSTDYTYESKCETINCNGRGALAENPEVVRAVGERDREGRERPHCLPAILSWNQF